MTSIPKTIATTALALLALASPLQAKTIEQGGDRYIINVDQMQLNGEESLLDILMMCPEIMSQNGRTLAAPGYFGQYAIRINNLDINMDAEEYLKETKARDVKKIQMCIYPGVMKGSGGMKKVIDIAYRKDHEGTAAKVALEGDTQASGELFGRLISNNGKAWVMGQAFGKMLYADPLHETVENANVNVDWNISSRDVLQLQATQQYVRSRNDGARAEYDRMVSAAAVITHSLSDNGAYGLLQLVGNYATNDQNGLGGYCSKATSPYGLLEFGFPFISKDVYVTAGVEAGYAATTDGIAKYTDRDTYEDFYAQVDWTNGKWGAMLGDRFRLQSFWLHRFDSDNAWKHSTHNNFLTATLWCNLDDKNTLKGSFVRRFYGPDYSDFVAGETSLEQYYTTDIFQRPIYTADFRYTYQQKNFNLMGMIRNDHQKLSASDNDNVLTTGLSAFLHAGVLRLTAGADYCWERLHADGVKYNSWVSLHLAPQVSTGNGWRFTANAIYNSRRMTEDIQYASLYMQPNFYLDLAASKEIGSHWLLEAKWHDIVDERVGNNAVSLGVTYTF